jgi:hypothetical protein
MKEWLVKNLKKYINSEWMIVIPLLNLLDKVMKFDNSEEYFEILQFIFSQEINKDAYPFEEDNVSKYISIIAHDIHNKYS